jgi:hypothetical protein
MRKKNIISVVFSVVLSFVFVAVAAYGATTISTNISTAGTLTVSGTTTLYSTLNVTGLTTLGNASTTLTSVSNTLYVGGANGLVISDSSILDSSGAISFGDENLSTSGTLTLSSGALSFVNASSTGWLKAATINSDTGAISFGDENLATTGAVNFATASSTGLASLDSVKISSIGNTISDIQFGTCTVTIGSVTASSTAVANCAAAGVTTSHKVFVTPYISTYHIIFTSASSTANDTIQIAVYNTGVIGPVDPADNVWSWMAIK